MTNELQIFCSLPKCEKDADTECIDCEYMVREEPKKRMTNEEAKKMLEAKLKCLIAETSGTNHDCNMRLCDGCALNYEQGNMGEQKEVLDIAIQALEHYELSGRQIERSYEMEYTDGYNQGWKDGRKALEQQSITWIVGKDNCQVAVRNMPIDKMQKICAIINDEELAESEEEE